MKTQRHKYGGSLESGASELDEVKSSNFLYSKLIRKLFAV